MAQRWAYLERQAPGLLVYSDQGILEYLRYSNLRVTWGAISIVTMTGGAGNKIGVIDLKLWAQMKLPPLSGDYPVV